MRDAVERASNGTDAVWVAFDVDALDAAYAPGTQLPRPGGLTSREVLRMVREASLGGANGFSVVEVAPPMDRDHLTSMVAAASILEFVGGIASRRQSGHVMKAAEAVADGPSVS
jgi:agmatinase